MRLTLVARVYALLLAMSLLCGMVSAQGTTTGRLTGLVTDTQGALIPGAEIVAKEDQTQQEFRATANGEGSWTIPSVPNGTYTVSISAHNFKTTVVQNVKVDAGQPATVNAVLEAGGANEHVVVTSGAEILQTETPTVSTTIVGRQITELPFVARDALQLVTTLPGVQSPGTPRTSSVNGLPKGSVNMTLDGANIQDNFLRSSDGFFASVQPKSDAVQEVTVSTAVPGAESAGEGAVQIRFVTKSGSSEFHGGGFWQYRSSRFNSNYYFNNQDGLPREPFILRQYGGHIGGPILIPWLLKNRNRAFFFLNYEEFHLPQSYGSLSTIANELVLTSDARNGIFTYRDSNGAVRQVNLYSLAASKGFTSTPDPTIAQGLSIIDAAARSGGVLKSRAISPLFDFNRLDYQFQDPGISTRRFPTARIDWNINDRHHFELIHNFGWYDANPDAVNGQLDVYAGSGIVVGHPGVTGSTHRNRWSLVMAHRWTISNSLVNEVRVTSSGNGTSVFMPEFTPTLFDLWGGYAVDTNRTSSFRLGPDSSSTGRSAFYNRRSQSRRNTPTESLTDNLNWLWGSHSLILGGSYLKIKAFNGSISNQAVPRVVLGIASNDPINNSVFTAANFPNSTSTQRQQAGQLYAILTGRVSQISRAAVLDENTRGYGFGEFREVNHQNEFAFYAQDSWKFKPNLTLNYGLRWEIEPPAIHDNLVYTRSGYEGLFGVSGVGNMFRPGVFAGSATRLRLFTPGERVFHTRWTDLAPSVGFAWSPNWKKGLLSRVFGQSGQTVIRSGYSIAYSREGFATFTNMYNVNEGGSITLDVSPSITPSIFPAGSVLFRNRNSFPSIAPPSDTSRFPLIPTAGSGTSINEFDPNIKAGYTQSYTFGIQREITTNTALEIRYVGNHGTHLWRQYDLNEVNIFENGFLNQFIAAANNLAISRAAGKGDNYGNQGLPGQVNVPIITTAIGSPTDTTTVTLLQQGQAGQLANNIAFNVSRMNSLINAGLVPFVTLPDGTKVSNYFIVNPQFTSGSTTGGGTGNGGAFFMSNGIDTSFNALQIELRRRMSRGLLVQGSYQFAKALSNAYGSSSSVFTPPRTMRDLHADWGASPWDIRHSFKFDWLHELPMGPGQRFLNSRNPVLSRLFGGWQWGGVVRIQSGAPFLLRSGGRRTVNQYDAGVVLHNITTSQLQSLVKIRKTTVCDANGCRGVVFYLPDSIIQNTLAAFELGGKTLADLNPNAPYIGPPTTPGQLGQRIFLYGPWTARFDFNLIKSIRINERVTFKASVQFLNAFNRANFFVGDPDDEIKLIDISSSFGQTRNAYRDATVSGTNDPGGRLIDFQFRLIF